MIAVSIVIIRTRNLLR